MRELQHSIPDLLRHAVGNVQEIIRSEVKLVKAEIRGEASRAGNAAKPIVVGGVAVFFGAAALVACLILSLALILPTWASALIVGVALLLTGGFLLNFGRKKMKEVRLVPERGNIQWLRRRTR